MKINNYIFLDLETGSKNKNKTQPTQLAAIALDGRTGKIIQNSEFCSYIKPIFDEAECKKAGVDSIQNEALEITKITIEQLEAAPDIKTVWKDFCEYVERFNVGKGQWDAPIMAGFNIDNFDAEIVRRIAGQKPYNLGPFDKEYGQCTLFHPIHTMDIMKDIRRWTMFNRSIRSVSMDSMREYFKMKKDGAHNALTDVRQGAAILEKFFNLYKTISPLIKFEGCFAGHPEFGE